MHVNASFMYFYLSSLSIYNLPIDVWIYIQTPNRIEPAGWPMGQDVCFTNGNNV